MAVWAEWLTRKQASGYLQAQGMPIEASTLASMASNGNAGKGPTYYRVGWNRIRYKRTDLDEWKERKMIRVE